jgi:hypothetical protein
MSMHAIAPRSGSGRRVQQQRTGLLDSVRELQLLSVGWRIGFRSGAVYGNRLHHEF